MKQWYQAHNCRICFWGQKPYFVTCKTSHLGGIVPLPPAGTCLNGMYKFFCVYVFILISMDKILVKIPLYDPVILGPT